MATRNVEVIHSAAVLVDSHFPTTWEESWDGAYPYRLEVTAPREWVEHQQRRLDMSRIHHAKDASPEHLPGRAYRPSWYVPGAIEDYEIWRCYLTSYPYSMMYVDKKEGWADRVHVYIGCK